MSTAINAPIPAILTGQALRSLRDAGYSFAAALGEVIDNSIEAKANDVTVYLEDEIDPKGKTHVRRIAIADDGMGMGVDQDGKDVLQHYLQLGYSTRYLSKNTIGKYGVGAKLAAFNFAERIDVWSCFDLEQGWRHVALDLAEAEHQEKNGDPVEIGQPNQQDFPEEFLHLMPEGTGTVVLWSKIDRLEAGRLAADANQLRLDLEKELSRTFREFIHGGIVISVNDRKLLAHDPLFIMDRTWADQRLQDEARKAAKRNPEPQPKQKLPTHFPAELIADEAIKVGGSSAQLRVTLYPPEVTRRRGIGGDGLAKALRVPENQGQISFMRLNREISYTNVPRILPLGVQDPDRFIGIELAFGPELDDYFGVRHVKRGVEPHGELREQIRQRLHRYIPVARKRLEERWGKVAREEREHSGEHAPIQQAVKEADRTLPKSRVKPSDTDTEDHERALTDLAEDAGKETEEEQKEYIEQIREDPFVIESVSFPGQTFIDVQHFGNQVMIRLNTRHRFYRELWEPIRDIANQDPGAVSGDQAVRTARRTLEALSLLVVAYAKAESQDSNPQDHFTDLRNDWGRFLDTLLGKVKDVI
jgi:hypothetical protein